MKQNDPAWVDLGGQVNLSEAQQTEFALKRVTAVLPVYCIIFVFMLIGASVGLFAFKAIALLVAYSGVGLCLFYFLAKKTINQTINSSNILVAFLVFNISVVTLAYFELKLARGIALQAICLLVVLDMHKLGQLETMIVASSAALLPILTVAASWTGGPIDSRYFGEIMFAFVATATVPALLLVSRESESIRQRLRQQRDEISSVLARQKKLSVNDELTGLFDRRHLQSLIEDEAKRMKRTGRPGAMALLDIDYFKQVNDQFGHAVGDQVLRVFGGVLKSVFNEQNQFVGRWGGEEFLILMPDAELDFLYWKLEKTKQLLAEHDWEEIQVGLKVTFSAGTGVWSVSESSSECLQRIDTLLYRAKEEGRNRIVSLERILKHDYKSTEASVEPEPAISTSFHLSEPMVQRVNQDNHKLPLTDWLLAVFLGKDEKMRQRIRMTWPPMVVYCIWFVALWTWVIPERLISQDLAFALTTWMLLGATVPYGLIRLNITANWKEPIMFTQQMVWAILLVVFVYGLVPQLQPLLLQLLCHIVVFGFIGLSPKGTKMINGLIIVMLALMWGVNTLLGGSDFDPLGQALQLSATAVFLTLISLRSHKFSLLRLQVLRDADILSRSLDEVQELMSRDGLTGLFNRRYMHTALQRELARHRQTGFGFCIALIDLDHFKQINDCHGHQVGDEVLKSFSKLIQPMLREIDVVARWGGEEFLLLLPDTLDGAHGRMAIERIRAAIETQRLSESKPSLVVTMSAGVARHELGESVDKTIERADHALYVAKREGRNRVVAA